MLLEFKKLDKFFLAHPFRWLIFVEENDIDYFVTLDVLLASNVILAINDEEKVKLIQVYKIKEFSTKLRVENYGYWTETHGIVDEQSMKIISFRRKNFQKELLTMVGVVLDNSSYQYFYSLGFVMMFLNIFR